MKLVAAQMTHEELMRYSVRVNGEDQKYVSEVDTVENRLIARV